MFLRTSSIFYQSVSQSLLFLIYESHKLDVFRSVSQFLDILEGLPIIRRMES